MPKSKLFPNENEINYALRLPESLHVALVRLAAKDRRSLNAEIVVLLEQAVQQECTEPGSGSSEH